MKRESNDNAKIEVGYVTFTFDWNYIKDKTIIHKGTEQFGMVWVLDLDGRAVKAYGYEMINNVE